MARRDEGPDYRCPSCGRVVTFRIAKKRGGICSECGAEMTEDAEEEEHDDHDR